MDIFFEFPEFFNINIGKYVEVFVKWLVHDYDFFFDAIKEGVLWFLLQTRSIGGVWSSHLTFIRIQQF